MIKKHALFAVTVLTAVSSFAAETVTTQRTDITQIAPGGSTTISTKVDETQYTQQVRQVYTSAGIEQTKVARLVDLDRKIYAAWLVGDVAAITRYRQEQRSILAPEEMQKVYVYYQAHPLPANYPSFVVNTWAPGETYTANVNIGAASITPGGSSININSTDRGGAAVSPSVSGSGSVARSTNTGLITNGGGAASSPSTAGGSAAVSGSTSNNTTLLGTGTTASGSSNLGSTNASPAGAAGVSSNLSGAVSPGQSAGTGASGSGVNSTGTAGSGSMASSTGAPTGSSGTNSAGSGSTSSGTGGSASGSSSR